MSSNRITFSLSSTAAYRSIQGMKKHRREEMQFTREMPMKQFFASYKMTHEMCSLVMGINSLSDFCQLSRLPSSCSNHRHYDL